MGVPHFAVTSRQRRQLSAFLRGLPEIRTLNVPHDRAASTMRRLNCTACHGFHADEGPDARAAGYFKTRGEADLGDEGRLPPELSDVGARLNASWVRAVLEDGATARPYLATRMPQYGIANIAHLPADLCAVAGVPVAPGEDPEFDTLAAEAGRELVGARMLNCIQCHDIAGRPSTGTPGPDLAAMVERLRYDNFARWLHDPARVRPGTRMPSFFVAGRSGFRQHFDGEAGEQIRAMWCYLSQGELLPLPEGLSAAGGLDLDVAEEPLVFRTFMSDAGVRAIACGFPEQAHCAFDAEYCRLAVIWQGPFLGAGGAWANRGGSETNPKSLTWRAPDQPLFAPPGAGAAVTAHFRGYRLDEQRRPVFHYQIAVGTTVIDVSEQPVPRREGLSVSMQRRFALEGPPGASVWVQHGGQRLDPGAGTFEGRGEDVTAVTLSGGEASFDLEVTW
jgi:hypothetical protein